MKVPFVVIFVFALFFVAPVLESPAAAAPAPAPQGEADFMNKFREAMKINATEEMTSLVKKRQHDAVNSIVSICESIAHSPTEKLETEIDALRKAWKRAHDTRFVDIMYEYFSLLDPRFKASRSKLIRQYSIKYKEFVDASATKDATKLPGIGVDMQAYGKNFEEFGDWYMASNCWYHYALCFDEELRGKKGADLNRAAEGFGKTVEGREKIDLKDSTYLQSKVRYDVLGDIAEKAKPKIAEAKAESTISVLTTFEVVPTLEEIQRPLYTCDELYQMWASIFLAGNGSNGKVMSLGDLSPMVFRDAAAKASMDVDGDGTGELEISVKGDVSPVVFKIGAGDEEREVAFLATVGKQKANYQGFEMDLGPQQASMMIYIAPAGSVTGNLAGTSFRVIDDNLDGIYGSLPLQWAYMGTREGNYQLDMDSVVIGNEKRARPWSQFQLIGEQWYKFETTRAGLEFKVAPVDVGTGTIKLKYKGPAKPDFLVIQGEGELEWSYFDLLSGGKKGLEVPSGTYHLCLGQISKGKRQQMMKALVLPSEEMTTWIVGEGETVEVELGQPYGFDFEYSQGYNDFEVVGQSIVVTGMGGETYQRLWNCVVQPEVHVRKKGSTRGAKEEKLRPAGSQQEMDDWINGWFPFSKKIDKSKKGDDLELMLFEKKNKLFGKIESTWR